MRSPRVLSVMAVLAGMAIACAAVVVAVVSTGGRTAHGLTPIPSSLDATVQSSYDGPTAFVTSPLGHAVCIRSGAGTVCAVPEAWVKVREPLSSDANCNPCTGVNASFRITNHTSSPLEISLSGTTWVPGYYPHPDPIGGGGSTASFVGGRRCAKVPRDWLLVIPSHSIAAVCAQFQHVDASPNACGSGLGIAPLGCVSPAPFGALTLGSKFQWASRYAYANSGGASAEPLLFQQPLSPAILPNTRWSYSTWGNEDFYAGELGLGYPRVELRLKGFTDAAGVNLGSRWRTEVPAWLQRECADLKACSTTDGQFPVRLLSTPTQSGLVAHFEIWGLGGRTTAMWSSEWTRRWRVSLIVSFMDVQFACTTTGCSTMRLAPDQALAARTPGCPRATSAIIDQRHSMDTQAKGYCLAFGAPSGATPLVLGFVVFARDAGDPAALRHQGGVDEIAWAYPRTGF